MLGSEQVIEQIATATPPSASAHARPGAPALPSVRAGSNAYGLGQDATRGQGGMLLANPHFPWNGSGRFYQMQLTIPGRLNVSGVALFGSPLIEIGDTEHLAWSHTVSTAARATLYRLTLAPGDPTAYLVDGHREAMTKRTVTVQVRDKPGRLTPTTRTRTTPGTVSCWRTAGRPRRRTRSGTPTPATYEGSTSSTPAT